MTVIHFIYRGRKIAVRTWGNVPRLGDDVTLVGEDLGSFSVLNVDWKEEVVHEPTTNRMAYVELRLSRP